MLSRLSFIKQIIHFLLRDTENIQKYRLSHPEMNYLTYELARQYLSGYESDVVNTFHSVPVHGKNFILFPMCKDAQSEDNEPGVPFFVSKLTEFFKNAPQNVKDSTLLIPLFLCRGYFRAPVNTPLKRKHAVLMEIDVNTGRLQIHDGQSSVRWSFYPDNHFYELDALTAIKITHKQEDYHTYNTQDDDFSCGFYAHAYINHILNTGSSVGCENIKLNIKKLYVDKSKFLKLNGVDISSTEEPTIAPNSVLSKSTIVIDAETQDWSSSHEIEAELAEIDFASFMEDTVLVNSSESASEKEESDAIEENTSPLLSFDIEGDNLTTEIFQAKQSPLATHTKFRLSCGQENLLEQQHQHQQQEISLPRSLVQKV